MKIGIDVHAAEADGSGNCTYIRQTLKALFALDPPHVFFLYAMDTDHPFYGELPSRPNIRIREIRVTSPLVRIPLCLARATYRDKLDVLHVQYIAPPFHRGKLVATVHDLAFLRVPETFTRFFVWRSKVFVRRTARRAARIITGSRYSYDDLIATYGLDPRKVELIPYGVSPEFGLGDDGRDASVVAARGIRPPYILCVGRLNPRKNLVSLARAFERMKAETGLPHQLVIVGKEDFETSKTLAAIQEVRRDIVLTGFIPDAELPALYRKAEIFIYPSLFEGGGLPLLEAMAAGVPVVAARTTSLPEIVGDAGILVDPLDEGEIRAALIRLATAAKLRDEFRNKGRARAALFSWDAAARKTLAVYERIMGDDASCPQ